MKDFYGNPITIGAKIAVSHVDAADVFLGIVTGFTTKKVKYTYFSRSGQAIKDNIKDPDKLVLVQY